MPADPTPPTPPALDGARRDNAPKCGCGAEFPTIGELRAHIAGFYQSARHWEAPMSTDSMMLEVWAQWADKDGNRGAAALFRRVRAALEAGEADTRDARWKAYRTGFLDGLTQPDAVQRGGYECWNAHAEAHASVYAKVFTAPLTETTDG